MLEKLITELTAALKENTKALQAKAAAPEVKAPLKAEKPVKAAKAAPADEDDDEDEDEKPAVKKPVKAAKGEDLDELDEDEGDADDGDDEDEDAPAKKVDRQTMLTAFQGYLAVDDDAERTTRKRKVKALAADLGGEKLSAIPEANYGKAMAWLKKNEKA